MASRKKCKYGVSKRTKKCLKAPRKSSVPALKAMREAIASRRMVPAKYQEAMMDLIDAEWMKGVKASRK